MSSKGYLNCLYITWLTAFTYLLIIVVTDSKGLCTYFISIFNKIVLIISFLFVRNHRKYAK